MKTKFTKDLKTGDRTAGTFMFGDGASTFVVRAVVPVPDVPDHFFVVMTHDEEEINEDTKVLTDVSRAMTKYGVR
jgi:hypothetical protein